MWCSQTGDHPQEDLAKSGYRPDMRTENCISAKYYARVGACSMWASDLILFIPSSQAHVLDVVTIMCMLMSRTAGGSNCHNCIVFPSDFSSMESYKLAGCFVFPYDFGSIEWVVLVNNLSSTLLYSRDLCFKHNLWRSTIVPWRHLGDLDTNYIIFKNVGIFKKEILFSKNKMMWRRKWNLQEYFLFCQNEKFQN